MSDRISVEEGSGNVFADLGFPDAEEALAKSRLAQRIAEVIEQRGLTQVEAASLLGVDQPKISKLLRGQLREFSTDRLFRFLKALNQDIEIVVREKPRTRAARYPCAALIPLAMVRDPVGRLSPRRLQFSNNLHDVLGTDAQGPDG